MKLFVLLFGGCSLFFLLMNSINSVKETAEENTNVSQMVKFAKKSTVNDVSLIAQLQLLVHDIRMLSMGNYMNLKKEDFKYDFGIFDWNIGGVNNDQFFIELKNVDKDRCDMLINAIPEAVTVKINSFVKKDCEDLNSIQFIFN